MLWGLIPSALWAPYREVFGEVFSAGTVAYFILFSGGIFAASIIAPMRRLTLLFRSERAKIAFAKGLIPEADLVHPPTDLRLVLEAIGFVTPIGLMVIIFVQFDTSADWSSHRFSYYNLLYGSARLFSTCLRCSRVASVVVCVVVSFPGR